MTGYCQSVFRNAIKAARSYADRAGPKSWPFTARVFDPGWPALTSTAEFTEAPTSRLFLAMTCWRLGQQTEAYQQFSEARDALADKRPPTLQEAHLQAEAATLLGMTLTR